MAFLHRLSDTLRDTRGTTAIEFAIVAPLLLLFMFGVVEFGRALMVYNDLSAVSSKSARIALLDNVVPDSALEEHIRSLLVELEADDLKVDFKTETVGENAFRVVSISYPYSFTTPLFDGFDVTMSVTSRTPLGS